MKNEKQLLMTFVLAACFWGIGGVPICAAGTGSTEAEPEEWVDPKEVLEIGSKRDVSKIEYLRRLRNRREKHRNTAAFNAQMALAKMGEKKEMDEIVAEVKSADPEIQEAGILKLAYVANKQAVRVLIGLLDDTKYRRKQEKGPDGQLRWSDEGYEPASYQAMRALKKITPDSPGFKSKHPTKADIAVWKDWWKKNKQKYE